MCACTVRILNFSLWNFTVCGGGCLGSVLRSILRRSARWSSKFDTYNCYLSSVTYVYGYVLTAKLEVCAYDGVKYWHIDDMICYMCACTLIVMYAILIGVYHEYPYIHMTICLRLSRRFSDIARNYNFREVDLIRIIVIWLSGCRRELLWYYHNNIIQPWVPADAPPGQTSEASRAIGDLQTRACEAHVIC